MKSYKFALLVFLVGCAGVERDCASCGASSFGSDWIVVQYGFDGKPINCWELRGTAITNEKQTDGIYWQEPSGHLIHISGWYSRVQVSNSDWKGAANSIGIDDDRCKDGAYLVKDAGNGE